MRPDVVVESLKREPSVERDGLRAVALAAADVDLAGLDAEEERGAEGDGGAASGGELAQEGHDSGALVVPDGVVQGRVAVAVFSEQSTGVAADRSLIANRGVARQ